MPIQERKDLKYVWDFRLVRKDEQVICLVHQGSFIEVDPEGRLMITFDTLSDTTSFKKDNSMTLTMFSDVESTRLKLYFPISGEEPFTKREVEIMKLLCDGVKDTARLVMYGRENGLM